MSIEKIIDYDLVFRGKIVGKNIVDSIVGKNGNAHNEIFRLKHYKYDIEVTQKIKPRILKDTITIYSITQGSACGVNLTLNEDFYLFINTIKGIYTTGLCSGNKKYDDASKRFKRVINNYISKSPKVWKDERGKKVAEGKLQDHKPNGKWIFYYPDGNLKSSGVYKNGKKEGQWLIYLNVKKSQKFYSELKEYQQKEIHDKRNILFQIRDYQNGTEVKRNNLYD